MFKTTALSALLFTVQCIKIKKMYTLVMYAVLRLFFFFNQRIPVYVRPAAYYVYNISFQCRMVVVFSALPEAMYVSCAGRTSLILDVF